MVKNLTKPHSNEPQIGLIMAVFVYLNWSLLILIGRIRDCFALCFIPKSRPPKGYAPIVSDFESFYQDRCFGRINGCWGNVISSCASTSITVIDREKVFNEWGSYTADNKFVGTKREMLNLGSYNYLGFGDADSPTRDAVLESLERYGHSTTSARADLGTTALHRETERVVARYTGKEDAMIVGMGFATNSTILNCLCGPGSLIISDANNHCSIVVGARSSKSKIQVFKHNDPKDLEHVVRTAIMNGQPNNQGPWDKIVIIVEGIYSMEGEVCPLAEVVAIKKKYGCYLYVDEAHSIGAIGATGRGICEFAGVNPDDVDILMGTFTKSFGSVGGYLSADREIIDFFRSQSTSSLQSASISPPACQQIVSSFKMIMGEDGTDLGKQKLQAIYDNANFFRDKLIEYGFHILGHTGSPVVPLMLYLPSEIVGFYKECMRHNIAVVVVGFPATPLLLSRVRFCISAGHTREELADAAEKIREIGNDLGLRFNKGNSFLRLNCDD